MMYSNQPEPTYSRRQAIAGGLTALALGIIEAGCKGRTKYVPVEVPGQLPTPNGQPILEGVQDTTYVISVGQLLRIPLTGRDDFSPGANVNGVTTPTQSLELRLLPGTTDNRVNVIAQQQQIANPQRLITGEFLYTSPPNDVPGARSYVVQLYDGDLSAVKVVNIQVNALPAGTTPTNATPTAGLSGGTSGGAGTGNP